MLFEYTIYEQSALYVVVGLIKVLGLHIFYFFGLVRQSLSEQAPVYWQMTWCFVSDSARRSLQSANVQTCMVPRTYSSYGDRTSAATGPRLWNSLPVQLRNPHITYRLFRWQLKGNLFGNHGHGALWLLICSALENHLLTYSYLDQLWAQRSVTSWENLSFYWYCVFNHVLQTELEECTETLSQMISRPYLRTPRSKIIQAARNVSSKRHEFLSAVAKGLIPADCSPSLKKKSKIFSVEVDVSCTRNHHTAMGNHMPYGITQCYLPTVSSDFPAFTPAEAATRFSDPGGMQGWVDLGGGYTPRYLSCQRISPTSEITRHCYGWELNLWLRHWTMQS